MIRISGPIPLPSYMQLCLHDPAQGYYANRNAIGTAGDFITAPEISQMFGELIGVWCVSVWQAMGSPSSFVLAEAGPGKGTLMADLLRAATPVPGFRDAAKIRLIEASPLMIEQQKGRLGGCGYDVQWCNSLDGLPGGPIILVANEFLDCLPMRQFVKSGDIWRERCIGLDDHGKLVNVLGAAALEATRLPDLHEAEPDGAVFETAPARQAWIEQLATRINTEGGAALLIDYGHAASGFGDTFQAMRSQKYAEPLTEPGNADLTSHIDFAAVAEAAQNTGSVVSPTITQAQFLLAMGLMERAGSLGEGKDDAQQREISLAVERLASPEAMGELFKVLALADPSTAGKLAGLPPFAPAPSTRSN